MPSMQTISGDPDVEVETDEEVDPEVEAAAAEGEEEAAAPAAPAAPAASVAPRPAPAARRPAPPVARRPAPPARQIGRPTPAQLAQAKARAAARRRGRAPAPLVRVTPRLPAIRPPAAKAVLAKKLAIKKMTLKKMVPAKVPETAVALPQVPAEVIPKVTARGIFGRAVVGGVKGGLIGWLAQGAVGLGAGWGAGLCVASYVLGTTVLRKGVTKYNDWAKGETVKGAVKSLPKGKKEAKVKSNETVNDAAADAAENAAMVAEAADAEASLEGVDNRIKNDIDNKGRRALAKLLKLERGARQARTRLGRRMRARFVKGLARKLKNQSLRLGRRDPVIKSTQIWVRLVQETSRILGESSQVGTAPMRLEAGRTGGGPAPTAEPVPTAPDDELELEGLYGDEPETVVPEAVLAQHTGKLSRLMALEAAGDPAAVELAQTMKASAERKARLNPTYRTNPRWRRIMRVTSRILNEQATTEKSPVQRLDGNAPKPWVDETATGMDGVFFSPWTR